MSNNTGGWEIRSTQSARKHRIGRPSARHVMAGTEPTLVIHVMPTQLRG